ncbi:HDOD domain-containing protein [Thiovibrio sp. JS02]
MDLEQKSTVTLSGLLDLVESSTIASIKGTVSGILSLINDPAASPNDLKRLIQVDPPLAAKILRVANSSYYASSRTISDIDQALIWIGFDALKEIVLTQKMSELYSGGNKPVCGYSRSHLWRHSLAVAILAKSIYRREFGEKGNNAYAAGLMHDIGVIVEDQLLHQDFLRLIHDTEEKRQPLTASELSALGYDHALIGKALAERWNFPAELMEGIGFHHNPEKAHPEHRRFAKTIFIADYLMFEQGYGYVALTLADREIVTRYADDLGLQPFALDCIVGVARDEIAKIEAKGFLVA